MKQLERDIEETKANLANATTAEIQGRLLELETELAQLKSQPKANAEFIEKRRQESEAKRVAEEKARELRKQEKAKKAQQKAEERVAEEVARKKRKQDQAELRRAAEAVKRAMIIQKGVALAEVTRRLNLATKNDNETMKQSMERMSSNKEVFAVIINHTFSFA